MTDTSDEALAAEITRQLRANVSRTGTMTAQEILACRIGTDGDGWDGRDVGGGRFCRVCHMWQRTDGQSDGELHTHDADCRNVAINRALTEGARAVAVLDGLKAWLDGELEDDQGFRAWPVAIAFVQHKIAALERAQEGVESRHG